MFVIVVYDVGTKRVAKVMKVCRKYFTHVQKSVFEGMISDMQLKKFQREIIKKIELSEDQICIYEFDTLKYTRKEQIGTVENLSNII